MTDTRRRGYFNNNRHFFTANICKGTVRQTHGSARLHKINGSDFKIITVIFSRIRRCNSPVQLHLQIALQITMIITMQIAITIYLQIPNMYFVLQITNIIRLTNSHFNLNSNRFNSCSKYLNHKTESDWKIIPTFTFRLQKPWVHRKYSENQQLQI